MDFLAGLIKTFLIKIIEVGTACANIVNIQKILKKNMKVKVSQINKKGRHQNESRRA